MKFRIPASFALLVVLGSSGIEVAMAQPVAPVRQPSFTPFLGVMGGGRGGAAGGVGYFGIFRPQMQMQQLQAELQLANQNLMVQQALITNMVNMSLPQTGRGATFNNLGHWYPMSRYGTGGGFGGAFGGYGMVNSRSPLMNTGNFNAVGNMGGIGGGAMPGGAMPGIRR